MEKGSDLENYIELAKNEISIVLANLPLVNINAAAQEILIVQKQGGRVHVTGIGKPGHLANYIASLLSSTGTPAYFLHGTEASHGSSGQLIAGDIVICISNSGETEQMKRTVAVIKSNDCKIISVTGNENSWLALHSDIHLNAHINHEGGPLNRAPRLSFIAETIVLQTLSVVLQSSKKLTPKQYIKWHPSGTLGMIREDEN